MSPQHNYILRSGQVVTQLGQAARLYIEGDMGLSEYLLVKAFFISKELEEETLPTPEELESAWDSPGAETAS